MQLAPTMLMRRSGAERLRMGCDMFDAARALMRASLGDPNRRRDGSAELKVRLLIRTYGRDLDDPTLERIA